MPRITRRGFVKLVGAGTAAVSAASYFGRSLWELISSPEAPRITSLTRSNWAATVCRICPAGCGVLARVVDGRVVKIEGNPRHPLSQGKVCPRAQAALQVLYDPDRIQTPLRRIGERGEGRWEPVSWEEAIAQIATELDSLRKGGQAHTLLFLHDAPPGHMRELIERFCLAYGSPNPVRADGLDAERVAHLLSQGWLDLAAHNWEETAYALFFGGSFLEDWQPQVHMLRTYSYMRRGRPDRRARIVQIGPRFSVSAAKADEWVPLLPGRQGVLALGMAHVIIREQIYDARFVTDHAEGFEDFATLVLQEYTPDRVAGLTGVPTDTIIRLAREFAGSSPAVAVPGRGLEGSTNALFNHIAIHTLNALVGSIDVPGGVLRPRHPPVTPWEEIQSRRTRLDGAGSAAYPLSVGAYNGLPERITVGTPYTPQILFIYENNPLFESVAATRWRGAFEKIPTIVSFSSFMDESTLHADLVLPNHTFLERWVDGIPPGGMEQVMLGIGGPAVQPIHDTRHTGDVLLELINAVGGRAADLLPWASFEEMLRYRARGLFEAGGSIQAEAFDQFWNELVDRGVWVGAPFEPGRWDQVLATESGRFQFQVARLRDIASEHNIDQDSLELPAYSGDEEEYPLLLIPYRVIADAGCRAPNAPLLWEMYGLHLKEMWQSWVEISPETAHHLAIEDGDLVWVESPQARIRLKARIYEGAMPDAVSIPLGGGHTAGGRWASQVGGGNVAELVVPQTDPLIGTPAWCNTRVRVYKA